MSTELVEASAASVPATGGKPVLPELVERAGGAARFAWDEGQGVELAAITPGLVGQYLVGLGGSPAKRNQHLAAIRGFFDRLVNRHVCILNPAASVKGVKEQVIE